MIVKTIKIGALLLFCILNQGCKQSDLDSKVVDDKIKAEYFHQALEGLTDVIVHDIFSPPVASRVYVYPCIAAYECARLAAPSLNSLVGRLNGFSKLETLSDTANVSYNLAAIFAFYKVGKTLIFSEDKIDLQLQQFLSSIDSIGNVAKVKEASKQFGHKVAEEILAWADKDNYKQSRSFPKYTITDNPWEWKPTPPAYMEGIEPHWREIRPMVLDSAQQFRPANPPSFSLEKDSPFYDKIIEVYETVNKITDDQKAIASFWDCNPYVMNQTGHMMFATKKITPGGHWMGIANIAAREAKLDLARSVESAALVAIGLFDGFISCWDEKYRSNLIRPETIINEHLDENWIPVLQTPPFPEHTSGHSVISTSAAIILTKLHGDNFNYTDDVEVKYGLPIRKYNSFLEASAEAAISRLYGGIHYMPAIDDGVKQGQRVGEHIIRKLKI